MESGQADGVVTGVEQDGECAGGGVEDLGRAGGEAGGADLDFVGGGEDEFGAEWGEGDVGEVADDGGGGEFNAEAERRKGASGNDE